MQLTTKASQNYAQVRHVVTSIIFDVLQFYIMCE